MLWWLGLALAVEPPAPPTPTVEAVAKACGEPYELLELAFTFVVDKDGAEVVRRSHRWRPAEGTVAVTTAEGTLDVWTNPPPRKATDPGHEAWSAFVNDSYWLLAACKVTDGGVQASPEPGALSLSFGAVGLTPGDAYRLEVDAESRVTGWSYTLQSGRTGAFDWSPYEAVGPLNLSLVRTAREGAFVIRFEDVSAK